MDVSTQVVIDIYVVITELEKVMSLTTQDLRKRCTEDNVAKLIASEERVSQINEMLGPYSHATTEYKSYELKISLF